MPTARQRCSSERTREVLTSHLGLLRRVVLEPGGLDVPRGELALATRDGQRSLWRRRASTLLSEPLEYSAPAALSSPSTAAASSPAPEAVPSAASTVVVALALGRPPVVVSSSSAAASVVVVVPRPVLVATGLVAVVVAARARGRARALATVVLVRSIRRATVCAVSGARHGRETYRQRRARRPRRPGRPTKETSPPSRPLDV